MPHLDVLGTGGSGRDGAGTETAGDHADGVRHENITRRAVELGAAYYILKPFDMEILPDRIRQLNGNAMPSITGTPETSPKKMLRQVPLEKKSPKCYTRSVFPPISRVIFICEMPSLWS